MKNRQSLALLLSILLIISVLSGCESSSKVVNQFVGNWNCYKVSANGKDIVFSDYEKLAKMELTAEFTSNKEYIFDYYVNGKQGDDYPQSGTFTVDGEKLVFSEPSGFGEIIDDELVLTFSNGAVKQYFTRK